MFCNRNYLRLNGLTANRTYLMPGAFVKAVCFFINDPVTGCVYISVAFIRIRDGAVTLKQTF